MTGLVERAIGVFLVPERPRARPAAVVPAGCRAVVVGTAHEAPALAAAVALTLRAADGAPAAVVALWGPRAPDVPSRGPATPAAAGLAGRLARRDLVAAARGRLAWVTLPADPSAAAAAAHRGAAAVDGPAVTALAGARPAALEELVDDHDLLVIAADPGTALGRAATAAFAGRPASTLAIAPLRRGLPRALALAGVAAPRLQPPLRAARSADP